MSQRRRGREALKRRGRKRRTGQTVEKGDQMEREVTKGEKKDNKGGKRSEQRRMIIKVMSEREIMQKKLRKEVMTLRKGRKK